MWYIFEKRALWNVHLDGKLVAKFATEEEAKKYTGWAIPAEETTEAGKEEAQSHYEAKEKVGRTLCQQKEKPRKKTQD